MRRQDRYAIVGYGFRMPGGIYTADGFWELLTARGFVQEPVASRYGRGYEPVLGTAGPSRFQATCEGLMRGDEPYLFDPRLFGMSAREASMMDPQIRMLLTATWEAFEQAGWDHASLRNSRTGVFIGTQMSSAANWRPLLGANEYTISGTSLDMLANRISYTFNLMGPSAAYLSACSSGATAIHAAVTSLASGDCDQAVVGAASHLGSALVSAGFGNLEVISPDGACHSFDAAANGYMRSEGVFVYLVKPLAAAEADGDRVLAVIAGTAVNTAGAADGATGSGPGRMITAPTQHAQAEVMRTACTRAGMSPGEVDYIEAHATGTRVGDRIEGNAIRSVFGGPDRAQPVRVASVKTNVGHMEAAAFGCAVLKVLLMFERRTFAPVSRHFTTPNPDIDFTGMRVQTECEPFGPGASPVAIGINSFGFGGTNGHCLLTEYRPSRPLPYSRPVAPEAGYLVPLSARTTDALRACASTLAAGLPDCDLYTLAGNLSRRRTHFPVRTAFAATSKEELAKQLAAFSEPVSTVAEGQGAPRILMVFAGQGTQWAGCGRELYATEPVFRQTVDEVDAAWQTHAGFSLRAACSTASQEELDECQLAQPVIFMIEAALTGLLRSWGVRPHCVLGHSAGEGAAACAAGLYSLAEATRLMYHRATLQQRTAGSGRMLAVGLDLAATRDMLHGLGHSTLAIACENAPASTVVCGSGADVARAMAVCEQRGLHHRLLRGNTAFHSAAMDPIEADLREALAGLRSRPASVPFVSSVTGSVTGRLDAGYWWGNVREPVRFMTAMRTVIRDLHPDLIIEVSPQPALTSSVRQCYENEPPACVPVLRANADSRRSFHQALGALYREGMNLDFASRYPRVRPVSHLLPCHPRDEQRVMDPMVDDRHFLQRGEYSAGPLAGARVAGHQPRFEVRMSARDFPWLTQHRVQHTPIMPAAGYIELVLEAVGNVPVHFELVEFLKPCVIGDEPVRLQTELTPGPGSGPGAGPGGGFSFRISSIGYGDEAESVLHCTGKARPAAATGGGPRLDEIDRSRFAAGQFGSREAFYEQLSAVIGDGFDYGPPFRVVQDVRQDMLTSELLISLRLDEAMWQDSRRAGYLLPPALLDGGLQAFLCYLMQCSDVIGVPRRMAGLTIERLPVSPELVCHCVPPERARQHDRGQLSLPLGERETGSMTLYDRATGERIAHLAGYTSFHTNPKQDAIGRSRYVVRWQPKFVRQVPPAVDLGPLIGALPGDLRVAEFVQDADPGQVASAACLSGTATAEFWLLGATAEHTGKLFEMYGHASAAVRFATADLSNPSSVDLGRGLLRPAACDVVVADAAVTPLTQAAWDLVRRLLVPGGAAFVRHPEAGFAPPGAEWTQASAGLFAAPSALCGDGPAEMPSGPRWVAGAAGGEWPGMKISLDPEWLWSAQAQADMTSVSAIDLFGGADDPEDDPLGERLVARFLEFVRALSAARAGENPVPCRLTVVTKGGAFGVTNPRAAALWGAVRALGQELSPELALDLRLVDRPDGADPDGLNALAWLAGHDVRERELAISGGRLYAPRLVRLPQADATIPASPGDPYRLCVTAPGQIAGLTMQSQPLRPPAEGEVEIDVAATALNFRDVMVALDLLPLASYERSALGREVGIEGSGTVRRTGPGAGQSSSLKTGDRVIFMAGGCVANRIVVDERFVSPAPRGLDLVQAAAVMSVYTTAYYALIELARLRPGQRVLIHSALGGVGQAAIALALRVGATVYATAGTGERRRKLLGLGVSGAFDSHSFSWYDDLLTATNGEGVDVVLNSLAGHHVTLCLQALRPGGWHCEIGKVDIYSDTALGLSVFRKNLRFAAIDLDRLLNDDPARARELTHACTLLLEDRAIPPLPVTTYGFAEYEAALRFMASGQHEGKLVLTAPATGGGFEVADCRPFLDPAATYLVTGGLGGFGLHVLAYLVWAGARHLTLLDRDPTRRRDAGWVRHASGIALFFPGSDRPYNGRPDGGVQIDIVPGDVSCRADVENCVAGLSRPLKGVFHLAAVLDDRLLDDISPESVAAVFAPKAAGAWHLHQATLGTPLDHFVLFSSISAVFGNAGQSTYAVASAFLDGLAERRHRDGLPALSCNMAALAETGMAARTPHLLRLMKANGMPAVSNALAVANLDFGLRAMRAGSHVVGVDIERLPGTPDHPDYMRIGRWMANDAAFAEAGGASGLTAGAIIAELAREITRLSGHEEVGPQETIASFGVNSISIAELSAFIKNRFNYHVGALDLMTTATPESVAAAILHGKAPSAEGGALPQAVTDGELPRQCQEDLESLKNIIRSLVATGSSSGPVRADRFRAVFLTGATGFVGRFVLAELLRQATDVTVHCLVRAEDESHAAGRIRDALQEAGIWDDAYSGRIKAWPGDIRTPRFGLPEEAFRELATVADSVYHLAADLSLLSGYAAIRDVNTGSFTNILELALTRKIKPVFYASTMGVFPEYFCNFSGGFSGRRIDDGQQPDVALMKTVFPPELVGYPWSKYVTEQALEFARSLGLPAAIMRLPQMGVAASTGYTQSGDIKVRIAMAILDTGVLPRGAGLQWTEPVDTVSELLTRISLNPRRERTVYHLCNPAPYDYGLHLADFGFDLREASYAEFRRACRARGSRGPLHGHWPLVDHFADYWFAEEGRPAGVAVAAGHDAPDAPDWPGLVTTTGRSLRWISDHQRAWPYRRPAVSLDAPALLRQAERFAARLDVRFGDAYPPALLEGLDRLVAGIRAPAARIRADRLPSIGFELSRKLWNRASLLSEFASHPEIALERIEQPVFILGINRTGTTFLHRLLAQGTRFWAPYPHELARPALDLPEDERRQYARDVLTASGIIEAMRGIHAVDTGEPEEEFALLEDSFAAWTNTLRYFVPGYAEWLRSQGGGFAYGGHHRAMQHLSWQRGARLGVSSRQWLLKMPFHLAELEALIAAYPDAVFIQTHRDPQEFMPSWLGLAESVRSLAAQPPDRAALGAEQLDFMSRMLTGAAAFRSARPELDKRFIDVTYDDLVAAPLRVVADIYLHFGWDFDDGTRARTQRWYAAQSAQRRTEPRRVHDAAAYAVTPGQIATAFPATRAARGDPNDQLARLPSSRPPRQ